jgi:hypothetical protein
LRRRDRSRLTSALSTSASSGLTSSSRSVSVLDGAICSSGTSSPVDGSRYFGDRRTGACADINHAA